MPLGSLYNNVVCKHFLPNKYCEDISLDKFCKRKGIKHWVA